MLQVELELEKEQIPFAENRLKISSTLYGILMANIVFVVVNMCLTSSLVQNLTYMMEATEAFPILEPAQHDSPLAAKFIDCWYSYSVNTKLSSRQMKGPIRRLYGGWLSRSRLTVERHRRLGWLQTLDKVDSRMR